MTKVLVVDDSMVFRKILEEALGKQMGIRVIGSAANGKDAIRFIRNLRPNLVVLDVEMPEMDGLQTLDELRRQKLDVGVIMFSSLTSKGAQTTLEALSKGAFDFVPKPTGTGAFGESVKRIQQELVPKIRAYAESTKSSIKTLPQPRPSVPRAVSSLPQQPLVSSISKPAVGGKILSGQPAGTSRSAMTCNATTGQRQPVGGSQLPRRNVKPSASFSNADAPAIVSKRSAPTVARRMIGMPEAIGIGVSTGGPNALNEVIPRLPGNFPVPVFLVQHMPPVFTAQLAKRLDEKSSIRVVEAQNQMPVEAGTVYVAPGDFHMEIEAAGTGKMVRLSQKPPENSCRPAVDVLFRSIEAVYGGKVVAVIMTGMGQDGFKGIQGLKEKGAFVIAQDKETCVVWGMPRFVTEAGLADRICSLGEIAPAIVEAAGRGGMR